MGFFLGPQFGKKPAGRKPFRGFGINPAAVASALGMTPADLVAEFKNGKTLADIAAQEKGMTLDQLKEKIIDQEKQKLDQMVSSGKMTKYSRRKPRPSGLEIRRLD